MNRSIPRDRIFQPITVLVVSMVAAGILASLISLLFDGAFRWFLLYYFVPIAVPFVAFLFDRLEHFHLTSMRSWLVDLAVLIPALTRAFVRIPFVSGHALFLTYCLLTSRSKVARITAALVLLQVAYLKIFVTHDMALIGGIIAGYLASLLFRHIKRNEQTEVVAQM